MAAGTNIKMIQLSDIKPIALWLPDTQEWMDQRANTEKYFAAVGLDNVYWLAGIHAFKFGIQGTHTYLLDGRPEEQFKIGDKKVGGFLSQYVVYNVMNVMPESHFMFLEGDCKFVDGWKEKLNQALLDVPQDFDFLFVGSCCAADKEPVHVKGDVYEFPYRGEANWQMYPQCGHCYIVAKKCVPFLIQTQRDAGNPADISLIKYAFPSLKVYAILPRLADQGEGVNIAP